MSCLYMSQIMSGMAIRTRTLTRTHVDLRIFRRKESEERRFSRGEEALPWGARSASSSRRAHDAFILT
eukprot:24333-Pelagococcus_subviridis.AAC.1